MMNANHNTPPPATAAPPLDDEVALPPPPEETNPPPYQEPQQQLPLPPPPYYEAVPAAVADPPQPAAATAAPPTIPPMVMAIADHKVRISDAMKLLDDTERDAALISALRGVSTELESAEEAHAQAAKRVESARELFDWATGALSGYAKTKEPKSEELKKRGRKRKGEKEFEAVDYEDQFAPPADGPLIPPLAATSGGGMTEEQVIAHRDAFYQKLCGVPYAELDSFTPPKHLVNLKSRAQLDENIYITTHWDSGTETMDVMNFRRQHKSFYTKMNLSKENIGRRTGHHLRDLAGNEGKKVFCRFGKNDESLMYISVDQLYDAMFEMHCLTGHRGWQATKKIANLKYANLPQDQVRFFVDTCPICSSKGYRRKSKLEEEETIGVHNATVV